MDINHKAVEEMHRKLCLLRQEYVESKQKNILFGNGTTCEAVGTVGWCCAAWQT